MSERVADAPVQGGPGGRLPPGGATDAAPPRAKPADPLRGILGKFATGVTILAAGRDKPQGMTANSFTSVSLSPPLVLVCVNRSAAIHRAVVESKSFAISVLAAHQEDVARHFADHSRPRGKREFDIVGWSPGPVTGAPLIHGTLAWLECELAATYDGGTHSIFLGSVLASTHGPGREALLFYGGAFHRPTLTAASPGRTPS